MITPALKLEVEKELKGRITTIAPLSAANNAQIYRIVLDNKRVMVAKVAERGLDTEAFMLHYLKTRSRLVVPSVFYSNEHIIVMEFASEQALKTYHESPAQKKWYEAYMPIRGESKTHDITN